MQFKNWLINEMMYNGTAIIKYSPDGSQCVAEVDQGISDYYRNLIPKYNYVQPQRAKAHITIVRKGEIYLNKEVWGKYEGKEINFTYDTNIQSDEKYFWINAWSEEIGNIREELGLKKYRYKDTYHITIGNRKNQ